MKSVSSSQRESFLSTPSLYIHIPILHFRAQSLILGSVFLNYHFLITRYHQIFFFFFKLTSFFLDPHHRCIIISLVVCTEYNPRFHTLLKLFTRLLS